MRRRPESPPMRVCGTGRPPGLQRGQQDHDDDIHRAWLVTNGVGPACRLRRPGWRGPRPMRMQVSQQARKEESPTRMPQSPPLWMPMGMPVKKTKGQQPQMQGGKTGWQQRRRRRRRQRQRWTHPVPMTMRRHRGARGRCSTEAEASRGPRPFLRQSGGALHRLWRRGARPWRCRTTLETRVVVCLSGLAAADCGRHAQSAPTLGLGKNCYGNLGTDSPSLVSV